MRPIFTAFAILLGLYCYSQEQIKFSYDTAGNQIVRELICVTCNDPGGRYGTDQVSDDELKKSTDYKEISYYPNPVLEQLYLKWDNTGNALLTSIETYSINGQFIRLKSDLNNTDNATLEFQDLQQGIYLVVLIYNNDERKVLRIIKK